MSSVDKVVRRTVRWVGGHGFMTGSEKRKKDLAKVKAGKDEQFANAAMPDEQAIKLAERRKAARRRGSRAATVMTSDETLG